MSLSPGVNFFFQWLGCIYRRWRTSLGDRSLASVNLNPSGNLRTCPSSSPGSLLPEEGEDYVSEPSTGA